MEVYVQIPAFDERPDTLRETFGSITNQRPTGHDVTLEAWITPTGENDPSFAIAREFGIDAHEAPNGKLSARNEAHNHAVENGADVIVSWDADAPALSDGALGNLLEPFENPGVVAVNSVPVSHRDPEGTPSALGAVIDAAASVEDVATPHIHGQCAALSSGLWQKAGPFDTSIDETDLHQVRAQEEFGLFRAARQHGRVETANARVYNHPRRTLCRIPGMGDSDYCNQRGVETFTNRPRRD